MMSLCCLKNALFPFLLTAIAVLFLKFIYDYFTIDKIFRKLKGKRVIITGGSSGIGLSLAKLSYQHGAHVTIIGRNVEKLKLAQEEISFQNGRNHDNVEIMSVDVCSDYDTLQKAMEPKLGKVDVLINCAGAAVSRTLLNTTPLEIEGQMRLNYFGSCNMTKIFLPAMLKTKTDSNIVFISSMAGQAGLYGLAAYSASKFALRGLAESLRMEVGHLGVSVTLAFPPDTRTPGFDNEQIGKPETTKRLSEAGGLIEPDYVARCIWRSVLRGRFFSSIGLDGWLLTQLTYGMCVPESLLEASSLIVFGPVARLVAVGYGLWMRRIVCHSRDK